MIGNEFTVDWTPYLDAEWDEPVDTTISPARAAKTSRYFTDLPGRFSFPFLIWLGFNWEAIMKMLNVTRDEDKKDKKASKRKKKK